PARSARDAGRLLQRLLHQPQPAIANRHAGPLYPRVSGRRVPDQLGEVVQFLLGGQHQEPPGELFPDDRRTAAGEVRMSCVVGIDLGSTTTKALILDERGEVLGRGITNSRSNYDLAAAVAKTEAFINARFSLVEQQAAGTDAAGVVGRLRRAFVMEQLLHQLRHLEQLMLAEVDASAPRELTAAFHVALTEICRQITAEEEQRF